MKGRAKRKLVTHTLALSLIDVVKGKEEFERLQSYWNAYHCQSKVYMVNGRLHGRYCKNRCCLLCCSIRKAEIINKYFPIIDQWEDPHFVTLTARTLSKERLKKRMQSMLNGLRLICAKYRKQAQRGKGEKLVGIKSLECTYNPKTKKYHPHLHIIVANKKMADVIVKDWIQMSPTHLVNKKGQYKERVWNKEKALIEIIKYASKVFTEPDVHNKTKKQCNRPLYAAALDNILCAMKGLRVFDRFGLNLPKSKKKEKSSFATTDYEEYTFTFNARDWLNEPTESKMTGYLASPSLLNILQNHIDKESQ